MTGAIFLDRDGVINKCVRGKWTDHEDDFELYPYTIEALKLLQRTNVPIFVVTNQSGIARGTLKHSEYYKITYKMLRLFEESDIEIARVYECMHPKDGSVNCSCRKPKTGMVQQAIKDYELHGKMWMVGDMFTDIAMAHAANLTPIMVKTGLFNEEECQKAVDLTRELGKDLYIDTDLYKASQRIVKCSPAPGNTS